MSFEPENDKMVQYLSSGLSASAEILEKQITSLTIRVLELEKFLDYYQKEVEEIREKQEEK